MMIVDDEKRTRESIADFIDWKSIGVEVNALAGNGEEALELIEANKPDILLSDIRMPHMDGIKLAEIVTKRFPEIKIIFLSAYTDKEYLKSAISLKVENYVEKPINPDELLETVKTAVNDLDHLETNEILQGLKYTSRMIKEEIAALLISSQGSGYIEVYSRFYPLYFTWEKNGRFSIANIHVHSENLNGDKLQEITGKMYDIFDQHNISEIFISPMINGDFVWIGSNVDKEDLKQAFNELSSMSPYDISGGLTFCSNIDEFTSAWKTASRYAQNRFYFGRNLMFDEEVDSDILDNFPEDLFSKLPDTYEESVQLFDDLQNTRYKDISIIQDNLYQFYLKMMEWTVNESTLTKESFASLTLQEIRELILYGMHVFNTLGNNQYNPKVKNALHFVLWNYQNPNLSIKMISDKVGLSQNYLSNLFKQETGITINSFIIDVRIEKTEKLLRTSDLKLYEIAEKVGIPDPNYLSFIFKGKTGMTPSEYKQKTRKNI